MTGILYFSISAKSAKPSIPGSIMSSSARSKECSFSKAAAASPPSSKVETSYPTIRRFSATASAIA